MRIITKYEPTAPPLPQRKRVAAYARVSSGKDAQLHSLSAQISYYSAYIQKRKEWEYMGVYADEAISGTKETRPEFQRLLSDCRGGKIDMIITKSISRLARNTVTMLETVRELKLIGVDVYFEKENIHSISGDGELMLTILASYAQEEAQSVSENCKWRMRKRFENGQMFGVRRLYGYDIDKGGIAINEERAAIVRMIFEEYIGGIGSIRIANKLNEMGVPTSAGGKWSVSSVTNIIRNEKYTGNSLLQKTFMGGDVVKRQKKNRGQLPKYYAENTHPAIINIETFERANAILNKRFELGRGKKPLLQGIIICDVCGKPCKLRKMDYELYWYCADRFIKGKNRCAIGRIADAKAMEITTEVLGLEAFDIDIVKDKIREIRILTPERLLYVFKDGCTEEIAWRLPLSEELSKRSLKWWADERDKAAQKQGLKESEEGGE